jgi:XRE family aerobic/anaerobic benzoate catabolism transcriptional regulator
VQLETGDGNISVVRLHDVAVALGTTAAHLLSTSEPARQAPSIIALLGLRGAGKTTIGTRVAKRLGIAFVELDAVVAQQAGIPLPMIFEMHGEAYFRKLEHDALAHLLDGTKAAVVATGGSIVTAKDTFELLRQRTVTVWLKARARDHWDRVVAQGDVRPMKNRANAMSELKALLRTRNELYAQADHVVDTSSLALEDAVRKVYSVASTGRETKGS